MDRRLDAAGLLVAASALLLVISLFLDWFGGGGSEGITAWRAFEVLDLVLLAAAAAAVAAAFGRLPARVGLGAALLVMVVVVSQLIQPPPAAFGADRAIGIWLALVAAVGIDVGAALAAAQIAVTVDVRGRERRPRVAAVDRRGPGESGGDADAVGPDAPAARPEAPPVESDAFARPPGSVVADPDATQSFPAPTETSEPR